MRPKESTIIEILGRLKAGHPGRVESTDEVIRLWHEMLEGLDDRILLEATKDLLSSPREHPPNVGQVRHRAAELSLGHLAPPSPFEAWERVQRHMRGEQIEFSDDEKRALSFIGGISTAKYSEHIATDRAHFLKAYEAFSSKRITETRAHDSTHFIAEENAPSPPQLPSGMKKAGGE